MLSKNDSLVVGLTYDPDYANDPGLNEVHSVIERLGHEVHRIGDLPALVAELAAKEVNAPPWDLVFNLAGGSRGSSRELQIPCLLDAYGIVHTFAGAPVMAVCGDKARTKVNGSFFLRICTSITSADNFEMVLSHFGIPTAPFCVLPAGSDFSDRSLVAWRKAMSTSQGPNTLTEDCGPFSGKADTVFVKPASGRSSQGIDENNEVATCEELNSLIHRLRSQFPTQDMLVETYLWGREFTVALIGSGGDAKVLAVLEIRVGLSDGQYQGDRSQDGRHGNVFTADIKSGGSSLHECLLADEDRDPEAAAAGEVALRAWRAMDCEDAGRVDVRSDVRGEGARPYVIEVSHPTSASNPAMR